MERWDRGLTNQGAGREYQILSIGLLVITLVWMAAIMVIMAWPDLKAPSIGVPARHAPIALLTHLFLFGVLGLLVYSAFFIGWGKGHNTFGFPIAMMVGLVWGGITELSQLYVPGRFASLEDVAWNVAGSTAGGFLAMVLLRRL